MVHSIHQIHQIHPLRPLLSLVMIVKDEASNIVGVLNSVRDCVDHIVILDTHSTDGTVDLVRKWMSDTGIPGDIYTEDFVDFSTTRNRSLDLAQPTARFSLLLSGDEYLTGGGALRDYLESAPECGAYNVRLTYGNLAWDSPRVVNNTESWRYVGVVHEILVGPTGGTQYRVPNVSIAHRDADAERKNNRRYSDLQLLHKQHAKNPQDPRTAFYLGQTLGELGFCAEAIAIYNRRIALGGWQEEVYESMYRIGTLSDRGGKPWAESQQRFLEAYLHSPHRAEPLYAIALHYYLAGNHALTFLFAHAGSKIPYPEKSVLFVQPDVYRFQLHDLVAISGFYLGDEEKKIGARSAQIVVDACPNDVRAQKNLELYRTLLLPPTTHRIGFDGGESPSADVVDTDALAGGSTGTLDPVVAGV